MVASERVTYKGYLHLDEILHTQTTLAPADLGAQVYAAEHFFIVVHQTFELWFKQMLLDLECASGALTSSDAELALDHLQRVAAVQRLLVQQMVLFDHLSPRSFLAFRPYLGASSGAESEQFRALQGALGLRGKEGSPVYAAFGQALHAAGVTLDELYQQPSRGGALYRVAEALVDISEGFWELAAVHVQIVERTIGQRRGTGGSSGASFLSEALKAKAFPALWDVRTRL